MMQILLQRHRKVVYKEHWALLSFEMMYNLLVELGSTQCHLK